MTETTSTTFIEPPQERKVYIPNDEHDDDIESFVSKRQEYLSKPVETAPSAPAATPKRRAAARKRAAKPAAIVEPVRIPDPDSPIEPQEDKADDVRTIPSISSLRIEQNFSESESDSSSSDSEPPETPREHVYRPPGANTPAKSRQRKQSKPIPADEQQKPAVSPLAALLTTGELDRNTLITKIGLYRSTFGNRFSKSLMAKIKKVEVSCKYSDEELRTLHNECRLSVGASTSSSLILPLFGAIAGVYEGLAIRVGVKCQGVASTMTQDPEINKILTEMSIEYLNVNYIPPHYRLVLYVLNATYVAHRANTLLAQKAALQMQQTQQSTPAPVQPDKPIQPTEKFIAVQRQDNVLDIDLEEARKAPEQMKFDSEKYKDL